MKGFTLVELVIVIAIVIVLSVVSIPIYNSYVEKAIYTEGYAFLGTILTAQKNYYAEYGYFVRYPYYTKEDPVLGLSTKGNKYFTGTFCDNFYSSDRVSFWAGLSKPSVLPNSGAYNELCLKYNITTGATFYER